MMKKFIVAISALLPFTAFANGADGATWTGMMYWGGGMGVWGPLTMLVWLVVGILAAVWLWQQITKK